MDVKNISVVFDSHLLWTDPETNKGYSPAILNNIDPESMNEGEHGEVAYIIRLSGALAERIFEQSSDLHPRQKFISGRRAPIEGIAFPARVENLVKNKYIPSARYTETFKTNTSGERINRELFSLVNSRKFDPTEPVMGFFEFERYIAAERLAHAFFVYGGASVLRKLYYYSEDPEMLSDEEVCSIAAFLGMFEEEFTNSPDNYYTLNASPMVDAIQAQLVNFPLSDYVAIREPIAVNGPMPTTGNVVSISRLSAKRRITEFRDYIYDNDLDEVGAFADFEYAKAQARVSSVKYDELSDSYPTVIGEYVKLGVIVERYVRRRFKTKKIDEVKAFSTAVCFGPWSF